MSTDIARSDNRIDTTLKALRDARETALVPFITVGFPDVETSEALAQATLESGGDMLELGIPFSDPLAEGLTIQRTSFHALNQGVNVETSLSVVRRLRGNGVREPLIFMGYYNSFLRYGAERFVREAADAGLDGVIVPDLPPEEAGPFREDCLRQGVCLIPMLAPTSTDRRIAQACKQASGFIYCVSLAGVTGARRRLSAALPELVGRIRLHTDLPVIVGFGVSRREHVEEIGRFADGAACGSALLDAIDEAPKDRKVEAARDFVRGLKSSGQKRS